MRLRLLPLVAIALLAVGGCGLTENDSPQAIAPENLPPNLLEPDPGSSTTLPEPGETVAATVYLLVREGDTTRLSPVEREVVDPAAPGELLTSLLSTPSEAELETGVSTSIPTDTVLLSTELDEETGELVIDISDELLAIQGTELANAFAQLVYTATEVDGVSQVRFLVEGEEVQAFDAEGARVSGPVRRADYAALAPQS